MSPARCSRGFTVLELLVAATVALLLAGMALSLTLNTLGLWRRVQGYLAGADGVRPVLELVERDLRGAVRPANPGHWLAAVVQNDAGELRTHHGWRTDAPAAGGVKPATALSLAAGPDEDAAGSSGSIAQSRFGLGGVWLRLFSLDHTGVPVAVSYQIVRRRLAEGGDAAGPAHYLLCRDVATDVLTRGDDIRAGYDDLDTPAVGDVLADNVVDFGVWLYVRDDTREDGLRRVFPAGAVDTAEFAAANRVEAPDAGPEPAAADVMVRILTPEGATRVAALENGRGRASPASDAEWWRLVEAHSTVYAWRIELAGTDR